MIKNTSTINIDGTTINSEELKQAFSLDLNDNYSKWIIRPLVLLVALAAGAVVFFTSAFLLVASLAALPLLMLTVWAMRKKIQKDLEKTNPVVDTQDNTAQASDSDVQVAQ